MALSYVGVHGFCSSHREFDRVKGYLSRPLRAITLPGHETNPSALLEYTWRDLTDYATKQVQQAAEQGPVVVIGSSMGADVTAYITATEPKLEGKVAGIVLVAPYLFHRDRRTKFVPAVSAARFLEKTFYRSDNTGKRIFKNFTEHPETNYTEFPAHAFLEFNKLIRHTKRYAQLIDVPTLVISSLKDPTAKEPEGTLFLQKKIPQAQVYMLNVPYHGLLRAPDEQVVKDVAERVERFTSSLENVLEKAS